jgi:membrane protease YdiL (CAAX protease family)
MSIVEHRNGASNEMLAQQTGGHRTLLIASAICISWFVLALVSSAPAYYITIANGSFVADNGGLEYNIITHSLRLLGGLIMVFALFPSLLGTRQKSYRHYLKATGILFPTEHQQRVTLAIFGIVASVMLAIDLAQNGLEGLAEYHNIPLWLAAFTSLQAAIVEELLFRGIAFGVLCRRFSIWVAILVPSIFFGLAHSYWGIDRILMTASVGALFALLRWRTNNLWGPIAMHFLINFGFPIPVWLGWLVALIVAVRLEMPKQFHRKACEQST